MPAPSSLDIGGRTARRRAGSRGPTWRTTSPARSRRAPGDDAIAWVERLATSDPAAHDALVTAVVAGYYLHPEVQRRLGYPGQIGEEVRADAYPDYVDDGPARARLRARPDLPPDA